MLKIGVLLPARFSEAGDYLADARALDAAGVDSLWLRDDDFDPWLVLAGIAAVTGRARLAVSVSGRDAAPADALARRLATLDRLSRGRVLVTVVPAGGPVETEALIRRARESCPGSLLLHANGGSHTLVGARLADGLVAASEPAACHATFDQARDRRVGPDRDPGRAVAGRDRAAHRGQVDRPAADALVVEPGQQQQVLGQRGQPQRVGVHVPGGLHPVQAVRVIKRHLELGADAGDRAAQLVRGVRHQVALALLRVGQPGEHVVQRDRERAHLVPGRRHRQGARHAGPGHLRGAAAQRGDRPQRVPGEQPGGQGQQAEQQRRPDGQDLGQGGQAVAGLGVGDRGDDHVVAGRPHGHHPQQRRQAQRRPGQRAGLAGPRPARCW